MDKSVILWDVGSGKVLRKYRGHAGRYKINSNILSVTQLITVHKLIYLTLTAKHECFQGFLFVVMNKNWTSLNHFSGPFYLNSYC